MLVSYVLEQSHKHDVHLPGFFMIIDFVSYVAEQYFMPLPKPPLKVTL